MRSGTDPVFVSGFRWFLLGFIVERKYMRI
jgi:hypothetical protein